MFAYGTDCESSVMCYFWHGKNRFAGLYLTSVLPWTFTAIIFSWPNKRLRNDIQILIWIAARSSEFMPIKQARRCDLTFIIVPVPSLIFLFFLPLFPWHFLFFSFCHRHDSHSSEKLCTVININVCIRILCMYVCTIF